MHLLTRFRKNRLETFRVIVFADKQTNKQTDRQTDIGDYISSLAEVLRAGIYVAALTRRQHQVLACFKRKELACFWNFYFFIGAL